jgi:hypothetical protein
MEQPLLSPGFVLRIISVLNLKKFFSLMLQVKENGRNVLNCLSCALGRSLPLRSALAFVRSDSTFCCAGLQGKVIVFLPEAAFGRPGSSAHQSFQ